MSDIEQKLRKVLPELGSQKSSRNVVFHAKLVSENGDWACYLSEGSEVNGQFVVRGWFLGAIDVWQVLPLREVIDRLLTDGVNIHFDDQFSRTAYEEVRKRERRSIA